MVDIIFSGPSVNGFLGHISDMASVAQRDRSLAATLEQRERESVRQTEENALDREHQEKLQQGRLNLQKYMFDAQAERRALLNKRLEQDMTHKEAAFQQKQVAVHSKAWGDLDLSLTAAEEMYRRDTGLTPSGPEFQIWLETGDHEYKGLGSTIVNYANQMKTFQQNLGLINGPIGQSGNARIVQDGQGNNVIAAVGPDGRVIIKTPEGKSAAEDPNQGVAAPSLRAITGSVAMGLGSLGFLPEPHMKKSMLLFNTLNAEEQAALADGKIPETVTAAAQVATENANNTTANITAEPNRAQVGGLVSGDPNVTAGVANAVTETYLANGPVATTPASGQPRTANDPNAVRGGLEADVVAQAQADNAAMQGVSGEGAIQPAQTASVVQPTDVSQLLSEPQTVAQAPVAAGGNTVNTPVNVGLEEPVDAVQRPVGLTGEPRSRTLGEAVSESRFGQAVGNMYRTLRDSDPVSATGGVIRNSVGNAADFLIDARRRRFADYPGVDNQNPFPENPTLVSPTLSRGGGPVQLPSNPNRQVALDTANQTLRRRALLEGDTELANYYRTQGLYALNGRPLSTDPTTAAAQIEADKLSAQEGLQRRWGVPEMKPQMDASGKISMVPSGRRIPKPTSHTQSEDFAYQTSSVANSYVMGKYRTSDRAAWELIDKRLGETFEGYKDMEQPQKVEAFQKIVWDMYSRNPERYFREMRISDPNVSTWDAPTVERLFNLVSRDLAIPSVWEDFVLDARRSPLLSSFLNDPNLWSRAGYPEFSQRTKESLREETIPRGGPEFQEPDKILPPR